MNAPVMVDAGDLSDPLDVRVAFVCVCVALLRRRRAARAAPCSNPSRARTQRHTTYTHPQIAERELLEKKIPFTIRRYLPDGRCVCVRVLGSACACVGRKIAQLRASSPTPSPNHTPTSLIAHTPHSYEDWPVKELLLQQDK